MTLRRVFLFFLLHNLLIILIYYTSPSEGGGRIIHGHFFGKLNKTIPFNRKQHKDVVTYWISQSLTHDHNDTRTWKQRYFKNDTFYQEGGPACIFVSGESVASPYWIIHGEMVQQCSTLKGLLFSLEHRFYGESKPLPDASVESLKYLSISYALADLAKFVEFVKSSYNLKSDKIILYGGSYAGTLVAYFRHKYDSLTLASVASSAPINWKFNFKEYIEVVGRVILETSSTCYKIIKSGMGELEAILNELPPSASDSNNKALLPLKLCGVLDTRKPLDIQTLNSAFTGLFSYFVQYNGVLSFGIKDACNLINSFSDKNMTNYEIFANAINTLNSYFENDCIDFSNDEFCKYMTAENWDQAAVSSGARMWSWQVCNEVASFQTTGSLLQPFGQTVDSSLYVSQCQCTFGNKYNEKYIKRAVRKHLGLYGRYGTLRSRVIYSNGKNDPWAALGVISSAQLLLSSHQNPIFLIEGKNSSHCNDLLPHLKSDSKYLIHARKETFDHLTKWLGIENQQIKKEAISDKDEEENSHLVSV